MKQALMVGLAATATIALGAQAQQPEPSVTTPSGQASQPTTTGGATTTAPTPDGMQQRSAPGSTERGPTAQGSTVPGSTAQGSTAQGTSGSSTAAQLAAASGGEVEGTVVGVDAQARTLTVQPDGGSAPPSTFHVSNDTEFTFRSAAGGNSLADIRTGDEVLLRFEEADGRRTIRSLGNRTRTASAAGASGAASERSSSMQDGTGAARSTDRTWSSGAQGSTAEGSTARDRSAAADASDREMRPDRLPDTSTSLATWAVLGSLFAIAAGFGLRRLRARR